MGRNADDKTQAITEQCDTLRPAENRGTRFIFPFLSSLARFLSFPFLSRDEEEEEKEKKAGKRKKKTTEKKKKKIIGYTRGRNLSNVERVGHINVSLIENLCA